MDYLTDAQAELNADLETEAEYQERYRRHAMDAECQGHPMDPRNAAFLTADPRQLLYCNGDCRQAPDA